MRISVTLFKPQHHPWISS